jgi:hypothetical protein
MNIVYALGTDDRKNLRLQGKRQVTYAFSTEPHNLCLGKKDVIEAQKNACEKLLKYTPEASEKSTIEKEITELKMALGLMA